MRFGLIFDVDGVIVDSPHEEAWGESLRRLFADDPGWRSIRAQTSYDPVRYTREVYLREAAGKPRRAGALSLLRAFDVPDAEGPRLARYMEHKQEVFLELVDAGDFRVFDDAVGLMLAARADGARLAAASSSKNANKLLGRVLLADHCGMPVPQEEEEETGVTMNQSRCRATVHGGLPVLHEEKTTGRMPGSRGEKMTGDTPVLHEEETTGRMPVSRGESTAGGSTLLDLFDGNVCGRDFPRGKPAPDIFLGAAESMGLRPACCAVLEDAVSGVRAGVAGGFLCVGVARCDDEAELRAAGAELVVTSLEDVWPVIRERLRARNDERG